MTALEPTPDYAFLRWAYSIISGIPSERFDLHDVVQGSSPSPHNCNTIACAAGWLGMHPEVHAQGIETGPCCLYRTGDGRSICFETAMAKVFNIDERDAISLFAQRGGGLLGSDVEYDFKGTDKQLWLKRVRTYLAGRKQLSKDVGEPA